ncbi:MAG TPA: hypothetical protein VFG20_22460 [Planctomycetaceae bacterium]|nr:hypothetical protein [Planctomycetaceae bacterium]
MSRLVLSALVCSLAMIASRVEAADLATPQEKLPKVASHPAPSETEQKIRQSLNQRTEVAFSETPLTDALKFLASQHQLNMVMDSAALQDEGVDPGSPISMELSGISFRSTLRLMLKPLQLTYIVEDEVLKITTEAKADEALVTRVYPVRDLASDGEELASVLEAVKAGCDPLSWNEELARTITGVAKSRSLVIRQTQKVHDEIEGLLRDLRAANAGADNGDPAPDRRVN